MKIKHYTYTLFIFFATVAFAQETRLKDSLQIQKPKITFLDSIKKTFVIYKNAKKIYSLWMKDIASLNVYDQLNTDIKNIDVEQQVDYELSTDLLKERLKKMDEKSPFNIEYNIGLENVIKSFLKNRKRSFERLMGLSQFYFPLFEEELAKNNIPLEIKYLAVVESALNTKAISRVGATGLWQFMYQTGKQYGLKINSFIDERNEPLASSKAASQYMNNMFKIFNDWDLVLAAYNSGPGNVAKAIRRSGGQQNYWNIRRNLPKETQGYLPAFLATMYIFEYHKEHGIVPNKAIANHFATDTIVIKKAMTFKQISNVLNISIEELQFFNPSYKRNEIPYITGETNFLTLPKDKIAIFTSNEDKIYAYIDNEYSKRERPNETYSAARSTDSAKTNALTDEGLLKYITRVKKYKVQKGENIADIASKFDVKASQLKQWNGLKSNKLKAGRSIKVQITERVAFTDKQDIKPRTSETEAPTAEVNVINSKLNKSILTEKATVNKEVSKYHKVKKGETLGTIAEKYNVSLADLKKWNKLTKNKVALGKNLKITTIEKVAVTVKKQINTTKNNNEIALDTNNTKTNGATQLLPPNDLKNQKSYVVEKGDNLYTIAHKNNVTVAQLIEWNQLKDNNLLSGSELLIANNSTLKNRSIDNTEATYIVLKGDNLKNIAAKFKTSQALIKEWNNLRNNNLQLGQELIVAKNNTQIAAHNPTKKASREISKDYLVRKGDSLFSISKKFPGVSIADLKKWNNIKEDGLKPGMKLKIIG